MSTVSSKVALRWALGIAQNIDHYGYQDEHRAELVNAGIVAAAHYVVLRSDMESPRQMIGAIIDYEAGDTDLRSIIDAADLMIANLSHMNSHELARLKAALEAVT